MVGFESVWLGLEYSEQDLACLMDVVGVRWELRQVKCLARQLLEGLEYLHRNDIMHRDVKLQNILLTARGVLKLADFGLPRPLPPNPRPLTPGVVTIWYRAPELLLGTKRYTPSIDLWAAGLLIGELLLSAPVLPGDTAVAQLALIVKLLGSPSSADTAALREAGCPELVRWERDGGPGRGRPDNMRARFEEASSAGTVWFLRGLLRWDARERLTASEALGRGRSEYEFARYAREWWEERPRACEREGLVGWADRVKDRDSREAEGVEMAVRGGARKHGVGGDEEKAGADYGGYVFDFGEASGVVKAPKRHRR